jgi:hypothetical protein
MSVQFLQSKQKEAEALIESIVSQEPEVNSSSIPNF